MAPNFSNHYLSSLNVDLISEDANTSNSDTDKVFHLNETLSTPPHSHFLIGVNAFTMPYTWYGISARKGNNSFKISTNNGIETSTLTITVDDGNYTASTLMDAINTQFTVGYASLNLTSLYIAYYQNQNKFYINASPSMQSITFSEINMFREIGFESSSSVVYSNVGTCNFPKMFNFAGDAVVYIRLVSKSIQNSNSRNVYGILCCVDNEYMPGEYIYYRPSEIQYFKLDSSVDTLHIQLLDENMNDIGTLNGSASWRLTLSLHYSYNKDIILEKQISKSIIETNNDIPKV
jgi:uncharacterized protein with FMN-binding domain